MSSNIAIAVRNIDKYTTDSEFVYAYNNINKFICLSSILNYIKIIAIAG